MGTGKNQIVYPNRLIKTPTRSHNCPTKQIQPLFAVLYDSVYPRRHRTAAASSLSSAAAYRHFQQLLLLLIVMDRDRDSEGEMEDFKKKVSISEESDIMDAENSSDSSISSKTVDLLRRFLAVQQRRAQAYARLKRGFEDYMVSGVELAYQQLCSEITVEFNDCSKQVRELETQFLDKDLFRDDIARLLRSVQNKEKQKLQLTATIQVLKKAGRPSERLVSHENCRFHHQIGHECVHIHNLTEASGTEEAEADAEYDNALKEAIKGVQEAVTTINEHLEEVRYEIAALEAE